MEIIELFSGCLYSIKYDNQELDEYTRLFQEWQDPLLLGTFFTDNQKFLKNEIWKNIPSPYSAALQVIREANELSDLISELSRNTNNQETPDLDSHFHYLDGEFKDVFEYVPMKSYGTDSPSLLRLYAIKITSNCYLITGGGIKLAKKIQDSPGICDHVINNIKQVRSYLKVNGILDSDDM